MATSTIRPGRLPKDTAATRNQVHDCLDLDAKANKSFPESKDLHPLMQPKRSGRIVEVDSCA